MESGNKKSLSDALLQALESALDESGDQADRAGTGRAGRPGSRRTQAGEAVLRTLSAWLDSEAAELGELDERSTELRRTLARVLSENTHETQRGRPSLDDSPAPPARPSQSPADRDATPASRAVHSPLLAEKLAAKLAAVAAARESRPQAAGPMFSDPNDPPTESQAVQPQPRAPAQTQAGAKSLAQTSAQAAAPARSPTLSPSAPAKPPVPSTPAARPTVVADRYELITRIHQGGHTSVWRGIDTHAPTGESAVAIKLIAKEYADELDEATIAALIDVSSDPGLMSLRASGHQDGWVYQVSEWIDGQTLESLLRSRADAMSFLADLPEWMRQLAHALEALHNAGLVHGDLKPANVMISRDHTARLIDFDTVCRVGSTANARSLTPAFASPQRRAGEPADTRDDVYSIAVIAYRLFTGELPNGGDKRRVDGQVQPAPERPDGLDTWQWQALRRGLAPEREQRTPSVLELVHEIWETGRPNGAAAPRRARRVPEPRRSGGRRALAAAALVTLAVGGVLAYPQILGPDFGAPVLELRERFWPQTGPAPSRTPVTGQPESGDRVDTTDTPTEVAAAGTTRIEPTLGIGAPDDVDAPVVDTPVADTSAPDSGFTDMPAADAPSAEAPAPGASAVDSPISDTPVTDAQRADAPVADSSPIDPPGVEPAETAEPIIAEPPAAVAQAPAPRTSPSPAPSRVSFAQARIQVRWNAPAALVEVRRSGSLGEPASFRFELEPGLAEPDEDFIPPADNRVQFRQGEDVALIVIPLVQRTDNRGTRSLWLNLVGENIDPDGIREVQVVLMNAG